MLQTKSKLMVLILMSAGFLGSLSQNLLTSSLPSIIQYYHIDASVGQWLTTVYIMILGVITAISAYAFYRFQTKSLVQVSLGIFLIGCIIAFFAPNFPVLLIARMIQACGAGMLIPLLQIVVLYLFPSDMQGQALGLTGIIVGFAPAIGPTVSGILVDYFGWQSIFLLLIILSSIVLIIGHFTLFNVGERQVKPLDILSVVLYGTGFTTFMLAVTYLKPGNAAYPKSALLFIFGIFCLFIFTRRQFTLSAPLLKLPLFKHRSLALGTILLSTVYIFMMTGTILVPLYIQTICGYKATLSGLILLPGSLLIAILSPFSGKIADRFGAKYICLFGMICGGLGNAGFLLLNSNSSAWAITIIYTIRSLSIAILMTPCTSLAVQTLPLEDKPHGMAILNSLRQMSGSLFSTILVIIASITSSTSVLNMRGIFASFLIMTIASCAGLFITLMIPSAAKTSAHKRL